MRRFVAFLAAILMAQTEPQPLVPEGVHTLAEGPATMCGITAESATEFLQKVKLDPRFTLTGTTDRFLLYATQDSLMQFVFSLPGNTAHPLATCRHAYQENGAWFISREMRCDDTRERCDRAFLEFADLDDQVKRALSGNDR
jgi:hypothetical protein